MSVTRISPEEAQNKLAEGFVYVDVRSEQEFAEGHPAGAVNVPLMRMGAGGMVPNDDFVRVMRATFPPGSRVVLGCQSGGRSMRAAEALIREGYTGLFEQRAGWGGARDAFGQLREKGWAQSGLPTETGASTRAYGGIESRE
jgi:rhodanese-related sulfurtransferase